MGDGRIAAEKVRSRQAATLIALLANAHRDPKKGRTYRIEDFDPYSCAARRRQTGMKVTVENWDAFVNAFVQGGRRCDG